MDLDVPFLASYKAQDSQNNDSSDVDAHQDGAHGQAGLPERYAEAGQRDAAEEIIEAVGDVVLGFCPGIGVELRQTDICLEVQEGITGSDELHHIGDGCDGQAEENGDHADDIHIGQDPDPAALCVFLAEGFGEPAVVTGGPYGDGIIGKGFITRIRGNN